MKVCHWVFKEYVVETRRIKLRLEQIGSFIIVKGDLILSIVIVVT